MVVPTFVSYIDNKSKYFSEKLIVRVGHEEEIITVKMNTPTNFTISFRASKLFNNGYP